MKSKIEQETIFRIGIMWVNDCRSHAVCNTVKFSKMKLEHGVRVIRACIDDFKIKGVRFIVPMSCSFGAFSVCMCVFVFLGI